MEMAWNKPPKRKSSPNWTVSKHLKIRYVQNLNVFFVSEIHATKTPSVIACGWEVFQILLWKDGISKHVCNVCILCTTGQCYDVKSLG